MGAGSHKGGRRSPFCVGYAATRAEDRVTHPGHEGRRAIRGTGAHGRYGEPRVSTRRPLGCAFPAATRGMPSPSAPERSACSYSRAAAGGAIRTRPAPGPLVIADLICLGPSPRPGGVKQIRWLDFYSTLFLGFCQEHFWNITSYTRSVGSSFRHSSKYPLTPPGAADISTIIEMMESRHGG